MPKVRIPPSERISKEIMEIIQNLTEHNRQKLLGQLMSAGHLTQLRSKSGQLSMRKLVQESRFTGEVQEYSYECIRILAEPIMSMERQEGVIRMNAYASEWL